MQRASSSVVGIVAIGGPGTILPRWVESLLSWSLCLSCLSVSGYYWCLSTFIRPLFMKIRYWIRSKKFLCPTQQHDDIAAQFRSTPFLPLTTASRKEIEHKTTKQRYEQLLSYCRKLNLPLNTTTADSDLVDLFRSNDTCRRLASLMMRPSSSNDLLLQPQYIDDRDELLPELPKRLATLWPQLLSLPSAGIYRLPCSSRPSACTEQQTSHFEFLISVVLPAFRENGMDVRKRLQTIYESCIDPTSVELIIVDAGGCHQLDEEAVINSSRTKNHKWGKVTLLHFTEGGGRGPCLNYGARAARGKFLTFLHSDTILPPSWDRLIVQVFQQTSATNSITAAAAPNSCAFSFGTFNTLEESLPPPPGIVAVHTTANIRTRLFSLPYGDQCISIPSTIFRLVGGFPEQCIMEDYELMCLLRQRSSSKINQRKEKLIVLKGEPARCSSRRWQTYGVLYVTFRNSMLVNLYASGLSPEDLYEKYYGVKPPKRKYECSPWELELENVCQMKEN